jgi:hypothetical protein
MRPFLHTGFLVAAIALSGCSTVTPGTEFVSPTTPALERIPELRRNGAQKDEWENNLAGQIDSIETVAELKSILAPWELSGQELEHWASQFERASTVICYGTDLDGRMVIFYDRNDRSFATWASWDPPLKNEEVEQGVAPNA